jgi:hypothetical protein
MKTWHRVALALVAGIAIGAGGAWYRIQAGFNDGRLANGPWTTALNYGTSGADSVTRASVALRGILALPSTETVYWNASTDSDGKPLDGSCTYAMTGKALDARWWSVTYYDRKGFLVANPANIWSFSGASVSQAEMNGWRVTIGPEKAEGHWLPSAKGKGFELTLRMYNPGNGFRAAPDKAVLPKIEKERCA